jgi:hypothetical protein
MLLLVNFEAPGVNCAAGGTRLDSGFDTDGDGQLAEREITQTSYACNGVSTPFCVVSATPYAPGAVDPANPCHVCKPSLSTTSFTAVAAGTTCGETFPGTCQRDVCVATLYKGAGQVNLAVDDETLFWTQTSRDAICTAAGCVMKLPLRPGGASSALATKEELVLGIDAAGGTVYWSNNNGNLAGFGSVKYCPESGCGSAPAFLTSINFASSVAVGAGKIFIVGAFPAALFSVPIGGFALTTVYNGPYSGALPQKIVVADDTVYFAVDGSILAIPANGGARLVLASGLDNPGAIAVSGDMVYFTELAHGQSGQGTIKRVPRAGGNVDPLANGQNNPTSLVTDGTSLYWTNTKSGEIMKLPIGGGTNPTIYANEQGSPTGLLLHGNSVYWCGSGVSMGTPR